MTLQRSETFYPWSGADFLSFFLSFSFFSRSDLTAERDFLSLERSGSSFFLSVPGERNICPRNVLISLGIFRGVVFLFAWLLPGAYTIPAELRGLLYIETAYIETYYTETETETVETADIID